MYINWFTWILFFMIVHVMQKIRGNKNSPNSLNIMVNYHYHGENRGNYPVITIYYDDDLEYNVVIHTFDY